jgi:hypothetical protein
MICPPVGPAAVRAATGQCRPFDPDRIIGPPSTDPISNLSLSLTSRRKKMQAAAAMQRKRLERRSLIDNPGSVPLKCKSIDQPRGCPMYLKQADLFWGMNQGFIQSITAQGVKQEFREGDVIFRAEEPADFFFVLIQGRVRLELHDSGRKVYTSEKIGEIFGWSALIGRKDYAATVVCDRNAITLKFHKEKINRILDRDAENAALFYKQLAGALGSRLLQAYHLLD